MEPCPEAPPRLSLTKLYERARECALAAEGTDKPKDRERLLSGLRTRLESLPAEAMVLRLPIVYATGIRP